MAATHDFDVLEDNPSTGRKVNGSISPRLGPCATATEVSAPPNLHSFSILPV